MELKTWLLQERGRATALAEHLGVSLGRVSQIAAPDGVPKKYMVRIRDFTGGAVTLESMLSDLVTYESVDGEVNA